MFAKHWSIHSDKHGNVPLIVIYANTSNEFASMPKHVRSFCTYISEKYNIEIDLHEVRSTTNFFDVVRTEGYPVVSKKVARMLRDVRRCLKANSITYDEIKDYLDNGVDSANRFRALNFPPSVICYLTGITQSNNSCQTWRIPKKWRFLLDAPFEISHKCCDILKKEPIHLIEKELKTNKIFGTLAEDSELRKEAYLKSGCNAYKQSNRSKSTPMGFWVRQDILNYIHMKQLPLAPPYGEILTCENGELEFSGEHNTGCKLCLFGCHLEHNPNRIQRLAKIEPATYNFAMKDLSDGGLGYKTVMDFMKINYE